MKQNKPTCSWHSRIILIAVMICLSQSKLMAAHNKTEILFNKNFDDDKKHSKREKSFKNETVVRVVPDAFKKSMHITARPSNEKEIDFLVFDINGDMVADYKMKAGEKRTISDLK